MKTNVSIRYAKPEDFEAASAIAAEGQAIHADALPHIFARTDGALPREYFDTLLESGERQMLVAELDGRVVGYAVVEQKEAPPYDAFVPRRVAFILDFGVEESHQRQGIGKRLFQACVLWAKEHGASAVELNVFAFNERAIRFYRSLGMETLSMRMTMDLSR
jgi:ribosomal protein S18 acetylase RimI-like enzyme